MNHLDLVRPLSLAQEPPPEEETESPVSGLVDGITDFESACGEDGSRFCRWVFDQTESNWWAGAAEWFVAKPAAILLVVIVAALVGKVLKWVSAGLLRRSLARKSGEPRYKRFRKRSPVTMISTAPHLLRRETRANTLVSVSNGVVTVVVWLLAFTIILGILEVDIFPLIAGAGILGLALGFGAQNLVRDAIAGTFVILEDQYGVGDIIDVGEAEGTVERITLRVTRLRDVNGVLWHVPNGFVERVGNFSQEWARALLDVDVAYDSDLDKVERVLASVAEGLSADPDWQREILDSPSVWGVQNFGPDGVAVRLVLKTRPAAQWKVMRELRRRIKDRFDAEGIEIPFPQRTLWVRNEPETGDVGDPNDPNAPDRPAPPTFPL